MLKFEDMIDDADMVVRKTEDGVSFKINNEVCILNDKQLKQLVHFINKGK
jgi:hypothetical protein